MDLATGFTLEQPALAIPWRISERELASLVAGPAIGRDGLKEVTTGYYVLSHVVSLKGLVHELGLHFEPGRHGRLLELEFFRRSYPDLAASYREFQEHLEATFGPPTHRNPSPEGFATCEWLYRHATIKHLVFDRFGPEEHVRIVVPDIAPA
jgi:hypothetical protein